VGSRERHSTRSEDRGADHGRHGEDDCGKTKPPASARNDTRSLPAALIPADVLRIVENPAIPLPERQEAVRAVLAAKTTTAPPVTAQLANLLGALVARRRVSLVPAIAGEYGRLLDRQRGIAAAVVTSAAPLSAEETEAIAARVASLAGTTVSLRTAVDPALIGGVTVRIGDRLIDASVRGRLERLRDRIVAGAR
jgi:F-type H+-transporting ATPase subunit delta